MHPDITAVIARQRHAELTAAARDSRLAREARHARRTARDAARASRRGRARLATGLTSAR